MAEAPPAEDAMSEEQFSEIFEDCIARRDYVQALKVCNKRLKTKPKDRYAMELRQTVEGFIDATNELDLEDDAELAPPIEELVEQACEACSRGYEAIFAHLSLGDEADARLWEMGEQVVGVFWDMGHVAPAGSARRARLWEMSRALTLRLMKQLQSKSRRGGTLGEGEWLFEGLGEVWWCYELDIPCEEWLLQGCREEWADANGSMEKLVGYPASKLPVVPLTDLCDVLTATWTVERTAVNELLGGSLPALEYGIEQVFAEIRRRPLIEPPLEGSLEQLYIMTHVVFVLNCYNSCLPNRRTDCPWVYSYLERSLAFWMREVTSSSVVAAAHPELTMRVEALDVIAEIVDCLRGLGDDEVAESDNVREAIVWLLARQDQDGFFYAPGAKRKLVGNEYDRIHPTWTAATALQLDRLPAESVSPRCERWVQHARAAARAAGLATAPPPARPPTMSADNT